MLLKVMQVLLNSVNFELQLKDTKFTTTNKLIDLLPELKGFKFVTTLNQSKVRLYQTYKIL